MLENFERLPQSLRSTVARTMSHTNLLQSLRGLRGKVPSNLPATYMNDRMEGDLSPAIASPPLQYVAEIDRFVSPERKQDISKLISTFEVATHCHSQAHLSLVKSGGCVVCGCKKRAAAAQKSDFAFSAKVPSRSLRSYQQRRARMYLDNGSERDCLSNRSTRF